MKKLLLLGFLFSAGVSGSLQAQTYAPVVVSGFTADVIANGPGSVASSTSTDADGASFALVALDYVSPSSTSPTSALPNNGLINSTPTSGLTFQLANYSGNNSLRIAGAGTGTLTFATPQTADQVYVIATSGSGASTVTMTVNFTDATSQTFTQTVGDWFNGAGFAIQGISRVSRATNAIENSTTNPRLYQYLLTLSAANVGKTIQSVSFNKTSTGGVLNVLGITIRTIPSTLPIDAGVTSVNSPASGCGLTNQETISITLKNFGTTAQSNIPVSYSINGGTPVSEVFAGPLAPNSIANYSFTTKANLSVLGNYTIQARTTLTGDQLTTNDSQSKTITLSAPATTPTLSASGSTSVCSGSPVMLMAASSPGATFTWFQNGSQIAGASAANYITTSPGNYTAIASLGGCNSAASAPIAVTVNFAPATPTLAPGGATAFCNGGSVALSAFSSNPAATFVWFRNNNVIPGATSGTYTATTSGNYTASAVANGCASATAAEIVVSSSPQPVTPTITQTGSALTSSNATGNQWYRNATLITGATGRNYTPTANGSYTVITTINGCSSTASNALVITNTGIKNDLADLQVSVYPNPSSGVFMLELPAGKTAEIVVTDLAGRIVEKQTVRSAKTQLDLSKMAKGIYVLKVTCQEKTGTRKLIIE